MTENYMTFGKLRGGDRFIVLPHKGYSVRLHGDYMKASYLFMKLEGRLGRQRANAVRLRNGKTCVISNSAPVIRIR